jgi:hypothetical protein
MPPGGRERERGIEKGPPLPCPLLHKCVEEREIDEICKKLRCAPGCKGAGLWLAILGGRQQLAALISMLPISGGNSIQIGLHRRLSGGKHGQTPVKDES